MWSKPKALKAKHLPCKANSLLQSTKKEHKADGSLIWAPAPLRNLLRAALLMQAGSKAGKLSLRHRSEASRSTVRSDRWPMHLISHLGTLQSLDTIQLSIMNKTRNKQTHKVVEQKADLGSKLLCLQDTAKL